MRPEIRGIFLFYGGPKHVILELGECEEGWCDEYVDSEEIVETGMIEVEWVLQ